MNVRTVPLARMVVVAGLLVLLFILIARDRGGGHAARVVLMFVGMLVQGVALAGVVVPLLRRQRPNAAVLVSLGVCILVGIGLLFTTWSRVVWPMGAFSLLLAGVIVFATTRIGGGGASRD